MRKDAQKNQSISTCTFVTQSGFPSSAIKSQEKERYLERNFNPKKPCGILWKKQATNQTASHLLSHPLSLREAEMACTAVEKRTKASGRKSNKIIEPLALSKRKRFLRSLEQTTCSCFVSPGKGVCSRRLRWVNQSVIAILWVDDAPIKTPCSSAEMFNEDPLPVGCMSLVHLRSYSPRLNRVL